MTTLKDFQKDLKSIIDPEGIEKIKKTKNKIMRLIEAFKRETSINWLQ